MNAVNCDENDERSLYMTGNDILERALDLCALHSGGVETELRGDLLDLKARAPALLNVLIAELTPLHERLTGQEAEVCALQDMTEAVHLHSGICGSLLPFRLAALLIAEEDRELSDLLDEYARDARAALLRDGRSARHRIVEVYG